VTGHHIAQFKRQQTWTHSALRPGLGVRPGW